MDDSTRCNPTVLFFLWNPANGAGDVKDTVTSRWQKPGISQELLSKPDGRVDFSKIFYSNKQAKQNESNLILI